MKIKFWGVRGSIPAPTDSAEIEQKILQALLGAQDIDLSNEQVVQEYVKQLPPLLRGTVGGNTPCISIDLGDEWIIFDAGSGLRVLGRELIKGAFGQGRGVAHIFISHTHWDHIQGYPFFVPASVAGNQINIYSPVPNLRERFEGQQIPEYFPKTLDDARADVNFVQLKENTPIHIAGVQVNNILQAHPGRSYGYRLDGQGATIVYASDAEYNDLGEAHTQRYVEFMRDADLLIFDAQYTLVDTWDRLDWGHSSSVIGVDMAVRANVKRVVLFHFEPTYSDIQVQEILESTLRYVAVDPVKPQCKIELATEGLEFDIGQRERTLLKHYDLGDVIVLEIQGRFDASAVNHVDERLTALISDGPEAGIVIDLAQVTHLNIAGLKTLLTAQQRGQGVPLVLAAAPQNIREVLEQVGFSEAFVQHQTVKEAVSALEARQYLQLQGQTLQSRYRIDSKLYLSPKAALFKAYDTWFERMVTVKALPKAMGDQANEMLLREARAVANLNHPNIASVYDCISYRDRFFLVREYVEGVTLRAQMKSLAPGDLLPSQRVLSVANDILSALAYAHQHGVLHRYLRPKNVILSPYDLKVINFGMADDPKEEWSYLKVSYMAPEQLDRHLLDRRADLYAFGVMLYEMVTGTLPIITDTVQDLVKLRQDGREPTPIQDANPNVPILLQQIIAKLLSQALDRRYSSAEMVQEALQKLTPW
jgi:anti-anti-sigma factor